MSPINEIINAVRAAASANPDFIYEPPTEIDGEQNYSRSCVYKTDDGKPSCIIGHAFAATGYLDDVSAFAGSVRTVIAGLEIEATTKQVRWLEMVQEKQDDMLDWSFAVESADLENGVVR